MEPNIAFSYEFAFLPGVNGFLHLFFGEEI
jgi:hypothetical protein